MKTTWVLKYSDLFEKYLKFFKLCQSSTSIILVLIFYKVFFIIIIIERDINNS